MDKPIAWIKARELTYMKAVVEHGATEWKTNLGLKPEDGDVSLYAAPPQRECADSVHDRREWQGLTDEEIDEVAWPHFIGNIMPSVKIIVRQLEAKLKEKNNA